MLRPFVVELRAMFASSSPIYHSTRPSVALPGYAFWRWHAELLDYCWRNSFRHPFTVVGLGLGAITRLWIFAVDSLAHAAAPTARR